MISGIPFRDPFETVCMHDTPVLLRSHLIMARDQRHQLPNFRSPNMKSGFIVVWQHHELSENKILTFQVVAIRLV